jgi:hypothetical protein
MQRIIARAIMMSAVVFVVACGGGHGMGLSGLLGVKTVDQDWGACLKAVNVTVSHASGRSADNAGVPGMFLRFGDFAHRASFFVTDIGTPNARATAADNHTTGLLRQAEGMQPNCAGQRSGELPADFAGTSP